MTIKLSTQTTLLLEHEDAYFALLPEEPEDFILADRIEFYGPEGVLLVRLEHHEYSTVGDPVPDYLREATFPLSRHWNNAPPADPRESYHIRVTKDGDIVRKEITEMTGYANATRLRKARAAGLTIQQITDELEEESYVHDWEHQLTNWKRYSTRQLIRPDKKTE